MDFVAVLLVVRLMAAVVGLVAVGLVEIEIVIVS
jgi:hypothetical protein